ncbi:hypothetical protein B0H12DRAFT_1329839, partial [Mycena haematopus]
MASPSTSEFLDLHYYALSRARTWASARTRSVPGDYDAYSRVQFKGHAYDSARTETPLHSTDLDTPLRFRVTPGEFACIPWVVLPIRKRRESGHQAGGAGDSLNINSPSDTYITACSHSYGTPLVVVRHNTMTHRTAATGGADGWYCHTASSLLLPQASSHR